MIHHSETISALSKITDAGLFERLATAVLRQAVPSTYGSLTHPGMNAEGKTVKSPVDCIAFIPGANPPHIVAVHHTSGARGDLRKKWLHYPSTTRPRKGAKPTAPPGDVIKTMRIVENERGATPELRVTLALTTNKEPPETLTREIESAANQYGISIDIWSCSRIAHYLDNDPEGQWLRKTFLGIEQQRLSKQQLLKLSRASLDSLQLVAQKDSLIDRELYRAIAEQSPRPVAFVVGESGMGKTIACYTHMKTHIDAGGYGFVLTHEVVSMYRTLDQALDAEIRKLHPSMEQDAGAKARALCSADDPLLLLVEDVNRSNQPALLVERLAGWASNRLGDTPTLDPDWHLFCPIWPKVLAQASEESKKLVDANTIVATPFTTSEALAAVERRADTSGVPISLLEATNIAETLGNDPLLIALYDFPHKPALQQVIGDFTLTDYRTSLTALAREILLHQRLNPTWADVQQWLQSQPEHVSRLREIVKNAEIVRLIDTGQNELLTFRHDRVRAWILSDTISQLIQTDQLENFILSEPFFADVIGPALARPDTLVETLDKVRISNPLALFYALNTFQEPNLEIHHAALRNIHSWLDTEKTHGRANRALRWSALQVLSETESSYVIAIAGRFSDRTWPMLFARFRNGDVSAGIQLCLDIEPGVTAPWRDHQIAHANLKFGTKLVQNLDELLKQTESSSSVRRGGLRLAGHLAESVFADAIAACWASDSDKTNHLADYLWAAAECCGNDPDRLIGPVCDAWAALPDQEDGGRSQRNSLAADHVSWAFNEFLPENALHYFIERAKRDDLHWPIIHMLRGVDHPDAVELIAREFAAFSREAEGTKRFWPFPSTVRMAWERRQEKKYKGMSSVSRQRLQKLWTSPDSDEHLRRQAFLLWAATSATDDLIQLQKAEDSSSLVDDLLRARLERGDTTAIPQLLDKIKTDEQGYWWQLGKSIWSDELTNALEEVFHRRGTIVERIWEAHYPNDWITYELVIRLKPTVAERILITHWEHLKYSSCFVQAALYIATPDLNNLVREAMSHCPEPTKMLQFANQHFGIKVTGHPGVRRIEQVEALIPYFDYLSPLAIHSFWEHCNEHGWFDFRRSNLDARLEEPWRKNASLFDESNFFADLDDKIAKGQINSVDYLINRYLGQGEKLKNIFHLLESWLNERKTISALEIVAEIVVQFGGRCEFDLLCVDGIEPSEQAEAIVADTRFAVRRRSLV